MKNLEKLFEEAQTELKTMIIFHKAERTFRAAESHVFKDHQLTPTQFSVLETLYSKGDLRIQNLIDSILATSGNMTVVIRNMVRFALDPSITHHISNHDGHISRGR